MHNVTRFPFCISPDVPRSKWCIRGPLGPNISFFASPVKTRKDVTLSFCNCPNISYASLV